MGVSALGRDDAMAPAGEAVRRAAEPAARSAPLRVAHLVSHPIQYYAPLYQRLARRDDVSIKVFFTWHSAQAAVADRGFGKPVAWDIPLTEGYEFELVANVSSEPGSHRFFGLAIVAGIEDVRFWRWSRTIANGHGAG